LSRARADALPFASGSGRQSALVAALSFRAAFVDLRLDDRDAAAKRRKIADPVASRSPHVVFF